MCRPEEQPVGGSDREEITTQLRNAAPIAVRIGRSRGRSSRSWRRWSPVNRRSSAGPQNITPKTTSGKSAPPQNGLGISVWLPIAGSKLGISRSAPISQPMYQSGCAPFSDRYGWYGPHCQIGLIWISPPMRNRTAATAEQQPERAQRVSRPHRRADDVALAPARPRELRVVLAHDHRQVHVMSTASAAGMQQHVHDLQPRRGSCWRRGTGRPR